VLGQDRRGEAQPRRGRKHYDFSWMGWERRGWAGRGVAGIGWEGTGKATSRAKALNDSRN
jgi:hypothetical protein